MCLPKKGEKKTLENWFFDTVFPAHGFGNPQTYKIKNTGVDDPCPYYKIKNIACEPEKKTKDLIFVLFKCYVLDFVVRTWAIDTCVFDFVGLGIGGIRAKETVFTHVFHFFCN